MSSAEIGESITASSSITSLMVYRYSETERDSLWMRVKFSLSCIARVCERLAYNRCNLDHASWEVVEVAMRVITDSETNARIAWSISLSCLIQRLKSGLGASAEVEPSDEIFGGSVDDRQIVVLSI
jgi:hypothetical protein